MTCERCSQPIPARRARWTNVRYCSVMCGRYQQKYIRERSRRTLSIVPEPPRTPADGPSPRAAPEGTTRSRRLWCTHYDACLDTAVRAGWSGFSCDACQAFESVEPKAEHHTGRRNEP